MAGWKMVAARRAAGAHGGHPDRRDRFAVLAFDNAIETPPACPPGWSRPAIAIASAPSSSWRGSRARGGTEMAQPLRRRRCLAAGECSRSRPHPGAGHRRPGRQRGPDPARAGRRPAAVRVFTLGIDRAVKAAFLRPPGGPGRRRCELVESEDRLDEVMDTGPPPHRGAVRPRAAAVRRGARHHRRHRQPRPVARPIPRRAAGASRSLPGGATGSLTLRGTTRDGRDWSKTVDGQRCNASAVTAGWARAHLRDLEDRYTCASDWNGHGDTARLEKRIVDTSLRFGVLCRFTAYVAVDSRVVADGGVQHRVLQPVEPPADWQLGAIPMPAPPGSAMRAMSAPVMAFEPQWSQAEPPTGALPVPRASKSFGRLHFGSESRRRAERRPVEYPELTAARKHALTRWACSATPTR